MVSEKKLPSTSNLPHISRQNALARRKSLNNDLRQHLYNLGPPPKCAIGPHQICQNTVPSAVERSKGSAMNTTQTLNKAVFENNLVQISPMAREGSPGQSLPTACAVFPTTEA